MSKTFIVSDIHGRYDALMQALEAAKIVDKHGNRQADRRHKVYSIGDLANCVEESYVGDNACLDLIRRGILDGLIIGNHEMPYFDPNNTFAGFHHYEHISETLWRLKNAGKIVPCVRVEGTLISHAGFDYRLGMQTGMVSLDWAETIEAMMTHHWEANNFGHSFFSRVGEDRGGPDRIGGIIWQDFKRLQSNFPQIVGHTPSKNIRYKENAICIDVGAKSDGLPTVMEVW